MHPKGTSNEAEVPTLRYQGCWFQGTRSSRFRQKLNSILSHQKEVVSMSQYCRSGTPSLGRATVCRAGTGVSSRAAPCAQLYKCRQLDLRD